MMWVVFMWAVVGGLLIYFAVELAYGGGDPNSKDHNRPPWTLW